MKNIIKFSNYILENNSLILEAIDWNKSKAYFEKLAKNYRFLWITPEMLQAKATQLVQQGVTFPVTNPTAYQVMKSVKTLLEVIPSGQFGYIMFTPQSQYVGGNMITLIGNEKGIVKRMQDDVIKNYKSFSDNEQMSKGHLVKQTGWGNKQKTTFNVGTVGVTKQAGKDTREQYGLQTYTKPDGEISVAQIQLA